MIKYRKNENWGTYSFECKFYELDDGIVDASEEIQNQNKSCDIDIIDVSIRSTETIDKDFDATQRHFVTIMYALMQQEEKVII